MPVAQRPSSYEEWMWTLERTGLAAEVYTIETALRLRGELDEAAVRTAFAALVERHPALRTSFPEGADGPLRVVAERTAPLDFAVAAVAEWEAIARAVEEVRVPFDLAGGPLLRVRLLRLAEDHHLLVVAVHHIVFDGWSQALLLEEFAALYNAEVTGAPAGLADVTLEYGEFAAWQRERLTGPAVAELTGYWRERLAGARPLDVPADHPRPPVQGHRGVERLVTLPPELLRGARELARRQRTTLFTVLACAYHALLVRWCGQDDVCVGVPLSDRTMPGSDAVVGLFLNTVVLRPQASDDPEFTELVRRVRGEFLDASERSALPFSEVVRELAPERELGRNPLFQAMFVLAVADPEPRLAGLRAERVALPLETSFMDVSVEVRVLEESAEVRFSLDAELFDAGTATAVADGYPALLAAALADPGLRLSRLPAPVTAGTRAAPVGTPVPGPAPSAPADEETLLQVHAVWTRLLGEHAGVHDDFFEIGGNSLAAVRLVTELRAEGFGTATVRDVFETRTASALTARLGVRGPAGHNGPPVPVRAPRPRRTGRAIVLPPRPTGEAQSLPEDGS